MAQPEKMNLASLDIAEEKREQLKQALHELLPEAVNESGIDFDQLKRALGAWVEPGKERFGLQWPGKAECMKIIQQPSVATLKPAREESVNFDDTENLFIEGDNLEVLKLLQKSYFGKVKMIYIDPPYNTGKEFIYPDKFAETLDTYLEYTGQKDSEGRRFSTNTDSSGRYHSRWLSMMYPRLYLAKNLLTEDGVFAFSIDDHEQANLRHLCDYVFGEENFIAQLTWEKTRKNDAKLFSVGHEYLIVYAKSLAHLKEKKTVWRQAKPGAKEILEKYRSLRQKHKSSDDAIQQELREWYAALPKDHPSKKLSRYKWVDKYGPWRDRDISWPGGGGPRYDVIHPRTKEPCKVPDSGWRFANPESMQEQIKLGLIVFRDDHTEPPFRKAHLLPVLETLESDIESDENDDLTEENDEDVGMQVMPSVIYKQSQVAVKYLRKLMGGKLFDNPKDHDVLAKIIDYCSSGDTDFTALDFFAGSATTAEAILHLNQSDGGKRKFIMVQLPEQVDEKKPAYKAGYKTIADLSKERIRRAAKKVAGDKEGELHLNTTQSLDTGFKVFKLDRSNFKVWEGTIEQVDNLEKQLSLHVEHIAKASTPEDILYELLLKAGFALTTKVEKLALAGKEVFSIEEGALLICLEKQLTQPLIDALAEANPVQVICLDEGFNGNDQLKANAVQTFKARAQAEESEIVFRTV